MCVLFHAPIFAYARPTSLEEAAALLARPGARACAGGTDLLGCLRDEVFEADTVVSLRGLAGAGIPRGITSAGRGLSIGALTTLAEIARDGRIRAGYDVLAEGLQRVGREIGMEISVRLYSVYEAMHRI